MDPDPSPGLRAPASPRDRFPPQIKFIIGNEACERFSYYGMLSILTLYIKNKMGMDADATTEIVHLFAAAVYFLPIAGAWLADRWLGRYWTILSISGFYCLGHGALALFEGSRAGMIAGLCLIAIGAGGIKPCVSAFVGDQFGPNQDRALRKVYGLFYWSINFGALFGFALIPMLRDHAGYRWAFGVPGISMGLATFVFWLGRKNYVHQPPLREKKQAGFFSVFSYALFHPQPRQSSQKGFWASALEKFQPQEVASARAVAGILTIFATIPVFWALFNQVNTTWVLQGEKMVPFNIFGFKVDAERMQSAGALLVMIWVPILTLGVYPLLERFGIQPTPLRRMTIGMFLGAVSFIGCGLIQSRIDAGQSVSLSAQLLPYIILEAGEVMVSATGLEFAFAQAPAALKSMMMSLWLMTIAGGHFLVAAFTSLNRHVVHAHGASEFYFYAILMAVVAGVFAIIASRYRETSSPTTP